MILSVLKEKIIDPYLGDIIAEARAMDQIPDRLIVKPVDLWPACPRRAHEILQNFGGLPPENWPEFLHDFSFLRDLPALNSMTAKKAGQTMLLSWLHRFGLARRATDLAPDYPLQDVFSPGVVGRRVSFWIAHYEYFMADLDWAAQDIFFEALWEDSKLLKRWAGQPSKTLYAPDHMDALKGLIYTCLGFEWWQKDLNDILQVLQTTLQSHLFSDGGHITRSPAKLLQVTQALLDIRMALNAGGHTPPEFLQAALERAIPAIRFFLKSDDKLSLFHGTQEGDKKTLERIFLQSGIKTRAPRSLDQSGYDRIAQGRTLLIVDRGGAPVSPHNRLSHLAPLSFEMSYGAERLITSCGSASMDGQWQNMLRATAAHSTFNLENQNVTSEHRILHFRREDTHKACLLEAAHDGYKQEFGFGHTRRLYLTAQGNDLRGEDMLNGRNLSRRNGLMMALRFHLHPRVIVPLISNGREALLRLPSGIGWRFHHDGGRLELEDSIYMGESDTPRKTRQLVVYGRVEGDYALIKWALQREGGIITSQETDSPEEEQSGQDTNLLLL